MHDGLHAGAERPMEVDDAATDQAATGDVNDDRFNVLPLLVVERVFFVGKLFDLVA